MQNELQSVRRGLEEAAQVLRQNLEELQSVRQGQEETARMVRESQMESAQTVRKGKKPTYTFRKKGNEIQSTFIDQVVEQVVLAACRIRRVEVAEERGSERLKKAKEDLDEGIKILSCRQKMIKFADRLEVGWAMVEEYEDDALASNSEDEASNSEDEKRMEKAVREADRKVAKKRKLRDSKEAARKEAAWHELPPAFATTKPPFAPKITAVANGVGKKRLVVNLRHVNGFLWKQKFNKGLKAIVYLVDGIVASQNERSANAASALVRDTLSRAGWVCNEEKSVWVPTHRLCWLGFTLDLEKGSISVPEGKVRALQHMLKVAAKQSSLVARDIASLIGRIVSMGLALGLVARFMTQALFGLLETRLAWCNMSPIIQEACEEITFWTESFDQFNAQPIWHRPAAARCVYSDASDTGYGGCTVEHGVHIAQGNWLPDEAVQSSTWRKLVAVGRVLESVAHKLSNLRVRWFTDNQNVVRILQVGSAKPHIQVEALRVFKACICYNIHLEPEWIPRDRNQLADYYSCIVDYDDWHIDPSVFAELDALWVPYSVDRFASSYNKQVERFNSHFAFPGSEAVDAFTVDWHEENNWWGPSPSLIPRVIRHAETCKAQGTLVHSNDRRFVQMQDKECQASQCMVLHLVLYMQHLSEEPHLVLYMQHLSEELHLVLYMQHLSEELHLVLYMQHLSEELHLVLYMAQHLSEELHLVLYMQHLSEELHLVLYMAQHLSEELHLVLYMAQHLSEELHLVLYMQHLSEEPHLVLYMEQHLSEELHLVLYMEQHLSEELHLVLYMEQHLMKLKCADVTFNPEGMVVKIESNHSSLAKLFRGIVQTKGREHLRKNGGLSYTRLRELLLDKLSELGFDPTLFGMHSLRAGGAIAAANTGVENRLFKRHGRWKSESAKDGYVKDSLERRFEVSKGLGI
eukprot:Em0004g620a